MSSSTTRKTSARRKRPTSSGTARAASASSRQEALKDGMLVCPECGKTFKRPAGLGAHRNAAHGVAGSSRRARSSAARTRAGKTTSARTASTKAGTARVSNGAARRRLSATSRGQSRSSQQNGGQFDRDKLPSPVPRGRPAEGQCDRGAHAVARRGRAPLEDALNARSLGPSSAGRPGRTRLRERERTTRLVADASARVVAGPPRGAPMEQRRRKPRGH
jgi:uncharacterized C2H2 Zn-finger protein